MPLVSALYNLRSPFVEVASTTRGGLGCGEGQECNKDTRSYMQARNKDTISYMQARNNDMRSFELCGIFLILCRNFACPISNVALQRQDNYFSSDA